MFRLTALSLVALLTSLPLPAEDPEASPDTYVTVCPVDGTIDDGVGVLVERAVRESRNAAAIIFVINTFGGRVDSAVNIASTILKAPCPTIAYITDKGAISAGALISYACDEIIMAPGTNFGAAMPVMATPEGMMPTGEKELSFVREKMRALANENGHNADIAEAMVDQDVVLRARIVDKTVQVYSVEPTEAPGEVAAVDLVVEKIIEALGENLPQPLKDALRQIPSSVPSPPAKPQSTTAPDSTSPFKPAADGSWLVLPKGKLLTLEPKDAVFYGVIPTVAYSVDEVMTHYGYRGMQKHELVMTWAERVFRFLTDPLVTALLLAGGVGGIYVEMKTPGFGLPGILGGICLALFFGSRYVIGLAEWLDVLLVVVGLGLILLEIFVLPGFGLAGVGGILCLGAGIYLALTNVAIPEYTWDYARLKDAGISFVTACGLIVLLAVAAARILPQTPIYRRIVLVHAQEPQLGYVVQSMEDESRAIGLKGRAATVLRPAGRGRFGGKVYDVVSRAEYIEEGTPIVIVEVDGNRYVVDKIDQAS